MERYKNSPCCVYKIGYENNWYIGSAKKFHKRKQEHFHKLKKGIHTNKNLQNIFNNYPIEMQIIEICKEEDLKIIEQKYINLFAEDENITLLNIYKDSKSPKGHKYGEEVSNKKRESMQGMFVGVSRSEETKLKISKKLKNRIITEDWKNKISNSLKGRLSKGGRSEIKGIKYLDNLYTYREFAKLIGKSYSYISTLYGEPLYNFERKYNCDFSLNREGNFSQRVFIRDEKRFVFVEKNKVRTLLPSELIYLFHKSIKNELSLHTIFNKSWFYGK